MERITNEENNFDHNVEGDAVQSPIVCVSREEALQELNEMKTGKVPGPSEVSLGLIVASGGVRIQVMAKICQSPGRIWNASRMGCKHSGSIFQWEG